MGGLQQAFPSKYEVTTFSRMINCLQCTGLYPPFFINVKKVRHGFWSNQTQKVPEAHRIRIHIICFLFYWTKDNDIYLYFTQNSVSVIPTVLHTSMNEKYRVEHFGLRIWVHLVPVLVNSRKILESCLRKNKMNTRFSIDGYFDFPQTRSAQN